MSDQPERAFRNITAVGGIVVQDDRVLLVRMAYGPAKGRYLFPGGRVDPGETLDQAVIREVREETGIIARPLGIVGLRSRFDGQQRLDTYVMFLMEPDPPTDPLADAYEVDDARYFTRQELEDGAALITGLSRYMALRVLDGTYPLLTYADDFDYAAAHRDPAAWKVFR